MGHVQRPVRKCFHQLQPGLLLPHPFQDGVRPVHQPCGFLARRPVRRLRGAGVRLPDPVGAEPLGLCILMGERIDLPLDLLFPSLSIMGITGRGVRIVLARRPDLGLNPA